MHRIKTDRIAGKRRMGHRRRLKWTMRRATSRMRVLPDFMIIGAQKCGTTSLFRYLCAHPRVLPPLSKEVHFFDLNYQEGKGWYRAHFPLRWKLRVGGTGRERRFQTGEASPYYIFHPLSPQRAAALMPRVKLIALLRNPVDRAYSHFHHQSRKGRETLRFDEAVDMEVSRLQGEDAKFASDPHHQSYVHQHFSYLSRGIYIEQIKRWHRYFAREQLLIVNSEDFFQDPGRILSEVLSFLGLEEWRPASFSKLNAGQYPAMDPPVRERLHRHFRPYNEELYAYLGRDFGWDV